MLILMIKQPEMKAYYCGYNGHGQVQKDILKSTATVEIGSRVISASCCWSNIAIVQEPGNSVTIHGFLDGKGHQSFETKLPTKKTFKQVLSSGGKIFALCAEGEVWELKSNTWCQHSIASKADKLACNKHSSLVISDGQVLDFVSGHVFDIPGKVIDLQCGADHCVALTNAAEVYTWGSSLRGQLGNGEVGKSAESPVLVETLSGLGVKQVSSGIWHNAAVTHSGDLYTWGWNCEGQLGFPFAPLVASQDVDAKTEQVTVLGTPHPTDVPLGVQQVACGARHTLVLADDGTVWGCGWTLHGQLGEQEKANLSRITRLPIAFETARIRHVSAGGWGSIFFT